MKKNIDNKTKKSNAGRKWFDGKNEKEVITKLEYVWGMGGSDAEAAFFVETSNASLSRYLREHPEIKERKEALKNKPVLLARKNIVKSLEIGDLDTSKWYLERKKKDEFSHRNELTGKDGNLIETKNPNIGQLSIEELKKLTKLSNDKL